MTEKHYLTFATFIQRNVLEVRAHRRAEKSVGRRLLRLHGRRTPLLALSLRKIKIGAEMNDSEH